ncbi:DeoR/GlpR family DNA-binding transcription regulator [Geotoga petraea]|uniref:DeoR/GlpR transcriptional regulator n=1 Tax=Geotoga petraea TaxID=28234 RepID=A0A4Z0W4B8_9BACT|nr:DeoR/GlpR family DNA-binding transcription regulator [Geotoga petraea]TGG88666.1 DeoR/GlpR transcriptional regulator [Geotoga petraea]
MLKEIRMKKIVEMLEKKEMITTKEIAKNLDTPEVTIRRDLKRLENMGKVSRIHGGVTRNQKSTVSELTMDEKRVKNKEAKKTIANKAFELIEQDDVIFLDSGSTTLEITTLIEKNFENNLTVFTNSIDIINKLSKKENIDLFIVGNHYRKKTGAFIFSGYDMEFLDKISISKAFIGANAYDEEFAYTPAGEEVKIKKKMIEVANVPVLVVDSSKADSISIWKISKMEDFKVIVSESINNIMKRLSKKGVDVK